MSALLMKFLKHWILMLVLIDHAADDLYESWREGFKIRPNDFEFKFYKQQLAVRSSHAHCTWQRNHS